MGEQACKLKIILDSGSAGGYASAIRDTAMSLTEKDTKALTDAVAYPIIDQMIIAEKALEKAHNMFLDAVGYDGPRP